MRAPLTEIETGGGVWRIKWHPSKRDTLLSASMHAGGFVIQLGGGLINESAGKRIYPAAPIALLSNLHCIL
jgi:hypothetical protein